MRNCPSRFLCVRRLCVLTASEAAVLLQYGMLVP